jgi:hypothetical protein
MPGCQRGSETLCGTGLVASPGVWRQAEDVRVARTAAARERVVERWRDERRAGRAEGAVMVWQGGLNGGKTRELAGPETGRRGALAERG